MTCRPAAGSSVPTTRSSKDEADVTDETDEQILARYRKVNPYITATKAMELSRGEKRYRHLLVAAQNKARIEAEDKLERIRRTIFPEG